MMQDRAYLTCMRLSRHWGPYEQWASQIDEDEIWRQIAAEDLIPIDDPWMRECWTISKIDSLVSKKPITPEKMYPGDLYKHIKKKTQGNRSQHMKRAAAIINAQLGGK